MASPSSPEAIACPALGHRLPLADRCSGILDGRAELAPEVPDQSPKRRTHLGRAEQAAQLGMGCLQQILADIGQEVLMAGQHRNGKRQLRDQVVDGRGHRPTQIAHRRTGSTEGAHRLAQTGQDEIGSFGGDLPSSQHPLAPTRHHQQQRAAAILARGVDMHRPATITGERGLQPFGPRLMEPGQVVDETLRQRADLPGRDPDTRLVLDQRTDLLSLPMPQKTFQPHANHDIVAHDTRRQQEPG